MLSVIIPAYNEEKCIKTAYNTLNSLLADNNIDSEFIFVDDGSQDKTYEIITELAKKYDVETEVVYKGYPSKPLDLDGLQYANVKACINKVFPGVCVMPYVVTGATDARFYGDVCDACVRFSPVLYGPEQMAGMHGLNENIEADCLPPAVDYYKEIIMSQQER